MYFLLVASLVGGRRHGAVSVIADQHSWAVLSCTGASGFFWVRRLRRTRPVGHGHATPLVTRIATHARHHRPRVIRVEDLMVGTQEIESARSKQ
jgi:hypothetical protein